MRNHDMSVYGMTIKDLEKVIKCKTMDGVSSNNQGNSIGVYPSIREIISKDPRPFLIDVSKSLLDYEDEEKHINSDHDYAIMRYLDGKEYIFRITESNVITIHSKREILPRFEVCLIWIDDSNQIKWSDHILQIEKNISVVKVKLDNDSNILDEKGHIYTLASWIDKTVFKSLASDTSYTTARSFFFEGFIDTELTSKGVMLNEY